MRTSLEYSVLREEEYDHKTGKLVNRVKSRGFAFCVNGCETKEEHEKVINDFYEFLAENNVESYGFGGGTWEDAMRLGDEKNFSYLDIPVKDTEEKEYIRDLYKLWKNRNGNSTTVQDKIKEGIIYGRVENYTLHIEGSQQIH